MMRVTHVHRTFKQECMLERIILVWYGLQLHAESFSVLHMITFLLTCPPVPWKMPRNANFVAHGWGKVKVCLKVRKNYKMYLNTIFTAVWNKSESWNLAVAWKVPSMRNQVQGQWLGAEQDQLLCRSTGTSSGNCQEMGTCIVPACHIPRQPLKKTHPSWHLGGWAKLWSTVEMLDRRHQRVHIPAHARTAHKGLLQKILKRYLC